jgi:hypothetical protein
MRMPQKHEVPAITLRGLEFVRVTANTSELSHVPTFLKCSLECVMYFSSDKVYDIFMQ